MNKTIEHYSTRINNGYWILQHIHNECQSFGKVFRMDHISSIVGLVLKGIHTIIIYQWIDPISTTQRALSEINVPLYGCLWSSAKPWVAHQNGAITIVQMVGSDQPPLAIMIGLVSWTIGNISSSHNSFLWGERIDYKINKTWPKTFELGHVPVSHWHMWSIVDKPSADRVGCKFSGWIPRPSRPNAWHEVGSNVLRHRQPTAFYS